MCRESDRSPARYYAPRPRPPAWIRDACVLEARGGLTSIPGTLGLQTPAGSWKASFVQVPFLLWNWPPVRWTEIRSRSLLERWMHGPTCNVTGAAGAYLRGLSCLDLGWIYGTGLCCVAKLREASRQNPVQNAPGV